MNKVGSSTSSVQTQQLTNSEPSIIPQKVGTKTGLDQPDSTEKSSQQEARTRQKDSQFQADVRKQDLFAQAPDPKSSSIGSPQKAGAIKALKSENELRELIVKKTFPAMKQGLEASGSSVNQARCNEATGMMKNALERQGVDGITVRDAYKHVFLEIKTKEGKTLMMCPTASQFFKDGTDIDKKLQKEGFLGTKEEFRKMISDNIENWIFDGGWSPPEQKVIDAYRGKKVPDVSYKDATDIIKDHINRAEHVYFGEVKTHMGEAVRLQCEWYENGDLDKELILPNGIFPPDYAGPRLKKAYLRMDELLK